MSNHQPSDSSVDNGNVEQNETLLLELKQSLDGNPNDPEITRQYAKALTRARRFDEALHCWHKIEELLPEDPVPSHKIAKLVIARSRYRAVHGIAPNEKKPLEKKNADKSEVAPRQGLDTTHLYRSNNRKGPQKKRAIELTDWQRLERALNENPANIKLYLELSDVYIEANRDHDAERILTKGLQFLEDAPALRERWEDVTLMRSQKKLDIAERRVSVENTPGAKEACAEIRAAHQKLVLDIFNERCERDPDNKQIRYQFGMQLKRAGHHRVALVHFQEAVTDPDCRANACLEVGECLQRNENYPEALQSYRKAISAAEESENIECKKLALYRAGVLSGGIKLREQARRLLSELVELDPNYKDAAARLAEM